MCGFDVNEKCSDTINDIATSDHEMQVYIVCVCVCVVHVCVCVYLSLMYFPVDVNKFYTVVLQVYVLQSVGLHSTVLTDGHRQWAK